MSQRWNDEFNNELKHAPGAIFSIGRYVILPLVLLSLVVGAVGAVNGWFSEANTVARETVGPAAAAAVRK
jgi:hypothetical protein